MKQRILFAGIVVISGYLSGCKKDTPPPVENIVYSMEIEVTDNDPFKNAYLFCAFGDDTFLTGNGINDEDSTKYVFIKDTPIYLEQTYIYSAPDTSQIYFWIVTSENPGNQYSVELFKNGFSMFKAVGETLTYEKVKI